MKMPLIIFRGVRGAQAPAEVGTATRMPRGRLPADRFALVHAANTTRLHLPCDRTGVSTSFDGSSRRIWSLARLAAVGCEGRQLAEGAFHLGLPNTSRHRSNPAEEDEEGETPFGCVRCVVRGRRLRRRRPPQNNRAGRVLCSCAEVHNGDAPPATAPQICLVDAVGCHCH